MARLKIAFLFFAKFVGLFWLARRMTAHGLRIICYHGFSLSDEHKFRPKLFMSKALFEARLAKIDGMGFSIISLDDAVKKLTNKEGFSHHLVITVDDGWQGVEDIAFPILKKYGYPWTLYLTTYYCFKQTQVLNIAMQYLCWKSPEKIVDFSYLGNNFSSQFHLRSEQSGVELATKLSQYAARFDCAAERQQFLSTAALALKVDQSKLEEDRLFYLLNTSSVKNLYAEGVDIQLHTHRHSLLHADKSKLSREIGENKYYINHLCGNNPLHFCYPSGHYTSEQVHWLKDGGILSGTTCKPGINYHNTPPLELTRFLDGENISDIEFEAEMSGFSDYLRKFKSLQSNVRSALTHYMRLPQRASTASEANTIQVPLPPLHDSENHSD